jgi:hypothetical protein
MKKLKIVQAITTALGIMFAVRAQTQDSAAYQFRMGAGFPGDVNRTHPASILPGLMNSSVQAPRLYGDPVIIDTATNSYRGIVAGDTTTFACDGIAVRPNPIQQVSGGMTSTLGVAAPPALQPLDVLEDGFVMVKCYVGTPTKKGAAYVYTAASTGSHVQGGLESAAGANLTLISNLFFNGPPDASGICEARILAVW